MRNLLIALLAIFGSTMAPMLAAASADEDKVIFVDQDDPEMSAAIAKARATLSEFWRQLAKPDPGVAGLALKVAIPHEPGKGAPFEHFWLGDIERSKDKLTGIIQNDANFAKGVALGQSYTFTEADISDWMFTRNGKIVGNQTLRPLLKKMPDDEAAQYRAMLEAP